MIAKQIAREYFPDTSEEELESIIWNLTGYPHWWHPEDGGTPVECFRTCLSRIRRLFDEGISINDQIWLAWDKPWEERREKIRTRAYYLWEAAGKPDGRSEEFWCAAADEF